MVYLIQMYSLRPYESLGNVLFVHVAEDDCGIGHITVANLVKSIALRQQALNTVPYLRL